MPWSSSRSRASEVPGFHASAPATLEAWFGGGADHHDREVMGPLRRKQEHQAQQQAVEAKGEGVEENQGGAGNEPQR